MRISLSDEHRKLMGDHTLDATNIMNEPLTPLPKDEIRQFQGNYPIPPLRPGYRPQKQVHYKFIYIFVIAILLYRDL